MVPPGWSPLDGPPGWSPLDGLHFLVMLTSTSPLQSQQQQNDMATDTNLNRRVVLNNGCSSGLHIAFPVMQYQMYPKFLNSCPAWTHTPIQKLETSPVEYTTLSWSRNLQPSQGTGVLRKLQAHVYHYITQTAKRAGYKLKLHKTKQCFQEIEMNTTNL